MKKKVINSVVLSCLIVVVLTQCSLSFPSRLLIKNNSEYTINVYFERGLKEKLVIEKNKNDFSLVNPGQCKMLITAEQINFSKEYQADIQYQEIYEFVFDVDYE